MNPTDQIAEWMQIADDVSPGWPTLSAALRAAAALCKDQQEELGKLHTLLQSAPNYLEWAEAKATIAVQAERIAALEDRIEDLTDCLRPLKEWWERKDVFHDQHRAVGLPQWGLRAAELLKETK